MRSMQFIGVLGLLAITSMMGFSKTVQADGLSSHDLIAEAWDVIDSRYYDPGFGGADWEQLGIEYLSREFEQTSDEHMAIGELLSHLSNPSTRFLTPELTNAMISELEGDLGTGSGLIELLGVDLDEQTQDIVVVTPFPGTPAANAGLTSGDKIVRVDELSAAEAPLAVVMDHLRGPADTTVRIEFERDGEHNSVQLRRAALGELPPVSFRTFRAEGKDIGYVHIALFSKTAADIIQSLATGGMGRDMDGIILDLRNSPGGRLDVLQQVAGLIMGPVPIAEIQTRETVRTLHAVGAPQLNAPIVVLINEGTASASEVLASAMRHHGRAMLVGDRSFGKGLAHGLERLDDESSIMFTMGRIETLSGSDILTEGVAPDITVASRSHPVVDPRIEVGGVLDPQFRSALKELLENTP